MGTNDGLPATCRGMSNISRAIGGACLFLVLVLAACGDDSSDAVASGAAAEASDSGATGDAAASATPVILDAWSRQPAVGQSVAAVYGEIVNPTDTELVLVAASSPVTPRVELHDTTTDEGGMMTMGERDEGFVIAPGESLMLEPGGAHVMLLDIDAATYPTEVEVTFEFADAESITVTAAVQSIDDGTTSPDESTTHDDEGADGHDGHGSMADDASTTDASDDGMAEGADHDAAEGSAADTGGDDRSASGSLVIDVGPLHGLDDELIAGDLAPRRQRAVVADYVALIDGYDVPEGSPEAELLALLNDLDAALADEDLATATAIAGEAHDLAHAIDDGTAS
jgi:copper(I)-binding protein